MPKYSTWREGAAARKDARHTTPDDAPKTRGVPNKRNTKRWCKGKVGVEHKPAVKTYRELKNWQGIGDGQWGSNIFQGWLVRYCTECGKEIDHFYPQPSGHPVPKPTPEWAEEYFKDHPDDRPRPRM